MFLWSRDPHFSDPLLHSSHGALQSLGDVYPYSEAETRDFADHVLESYNQKTGTVLDSAESKAAKDSILQSSKKPLKISKKVTRE